MNSTNKAIVQSVSNGNQVGGIAGACVGGKIYKSKNIANIVGAYNVGGITGNALANSETSYIIIEDCSNEGEVIGTGYRLRDYYYTGKTSSANTSAIGGIVGEGARIKISRCIQYRKYQYKYKY